MNDFKNISIQFACDADCGFDLRKLKKLVRNVCSEFKMLDAIIQIRIVDDAGMIDIHRQFLKKNNTTDVISFDLSDEFEPKRNFQIMVNAPMARRQAEKRGHSAESELALYIVHGLLHQVGYDDRIPSQAQRMHEKEDIILQRQGFGVIYQKLKTKK